MQSTYRNTIKELENRTYHKLIIGAALKEYEAIENFAYLFTHAQANVIDISAFPHSVISAKKGVAKAQAEKSELEAPHIMVSVNIGKDPHFRRVDVDFDKCIHCLDCVPTCPSNAFSIKQDPNQAQELDYEINLCFACSNCIDYCPTNALAFNDWSAFESNSLLELIEIGASAIEIHLNNDFEAFKSFYKSLPELPENFLQSFSIGSELMSEEELIEAAKTIINCVHERYGTEKEIILQTDGIPISGARDITNKDMASMQNAKVILGWLAKEMPDYLNKKIFVQLAGGIDEESLAKSYNHSIEVNGVAIGSSARKRLQEIFENEQKWPAAIDFATKILEKSKEMALLARVS